MLIRMTAAVALCLGMTGVARSGEFDNDAVGAKSKAKPVASSSLASANAGSEMDKESPTQASRFRGWGGYRGRGCWGGGGWGGGFGGFGGYSCYRPSYSSYHFSSYTPCYTPSYSNYYTPCYSSCYTPCYSYTSCYTPVYFGGHCSY